MKRKIKKNILKKVVKIIPKIIMFLLLIILDLFYLYCVNKTKHMISVPVLLEFNPFLFRVMILINIIFIGYFLSKIINYGTKIISIRPIKIKKDEELGKYIILFTSQTEKNMTMYTDLKKYYIYVTTNKNKFIKNKFYFLDIGQSNEIKKVKLNGMPEAYDLRKFSENDFK